MELQQFPLVRDYCFSTVLATDSIPSTLNVVLKKGDKSTFPLSIDLFNHILQSKEVLIHHLRKVAFEGELTFKLYGEGNEITHFVFNHCERNKIFFNHQHPIVLRISHIELVQCCELEINLEILEHFSKLKEYVDSCIIHWYYAFQFCESNPTQRMIDNFQMNHHTHDKYLPLFVDTDNCLTITDEQMHSVD